MATDPDLIHSLLQTVIEDSLQQQAPVVKIQIKSKLPQFLTPDTIQLVSDRDSAYNEAKRTGLQDDMRLFKNLRNE